MGPVGMQGAAYQNRAIEGDVVALSILPPEEWLHMKGGALPRSADFAPVPPPAAQFM